MRWTRLVSALSILGAVCALPNALQSDGTPKERALLPKPVKLYDPTKTEHAPAKRSSLPELPIQNIAFTSPYPNLKRADGYLVGTVINGKFAASEDTSDASSFTFASGQLSWIPSVTAGGYQSGESYGMYGLLTNGVIRLHFGKLSSGAITDLFSAPTYPGELHARLAIDGTTGYQDLIWVVDQQGTFYLATSYAAAYAELGAIQQLVPVTFTPGSTPNFTTVIAAAQNAFINPARLWATTYAGDRSGYLSINVNNRNQLKLTPAAADGAIFYAPDYLQGEARGQRLITNINGESYTVASQSDGWSTEFTVTPSAISSNVTASIPAGQAGFVNLTIANGPMVVGIQVYDRNLVAAVPTSSNWMYGSLRACVEMVPIGSEPSVCKPFGQEQTYARDPAGFYASTKDGSIAGYMKPGDDGKIAFDPTFQTVYTPSYNTVNKIFNVYAKKGTEFRVLSGTPINNGAALGPLSFGIADWDTNKNSIMIRIPYNQVGLVYPPSYISNVNHAASSYFYNPADQQIYVFPDLAAAQAQASGMQELCIESVLTGSAPAVCAKYWSYGAVDVREDNPVQLYARQIGATGEPVTGWVTNGLQFTTTRSSADTWFFPDAPGMQTIAYTTQNRELSRATVRPGRSNLQGGGQVDWAQPSVGPVSYPYYSNDWQDKWMSVSSLNGGLVTPQPNYLGETVTWTWTCETTQYPAFYIFPDLESAKKTRPYSIEFCIETVAIGQEPTGTCAAQHP